MGISKRRFTEMQDYVSQKIKHKEIEEIDDIEETYRKLRRKKKHQNKAKSVSR